jgi:uncharacterized protein
VDQHLPAPTSNADSAPYWNAAKDGKLMLRKCASCQHIHFMPRYLCPVCWSQDLQWIEASGKGTVHSFTIIRRASSPAFVSKVPYVVALIDLQEGPRMMANIVGDDALGVVIDEPVTLQFEAREDMKLPQFARKERMR